MTFADSYGQRIFTHPATKCIGEACTVHKPSDHHMSAWPQLWRHDRQLMERTCPHGIGHPDPDERNLDINGRGVHGCDGCCQPLA